jgi:hypothetical protein
MKLMAYLMVAALLARAAPAQEGDARTALPTNTMSVVAIVSNVTQSVRDTHGNVVIGEKTDARITARLHREFLSRKVADVVQTNIVVNVNCGDPIYHVAIQVGNGIITNLAVRLTPICWYDSAR